MSTSLARSIKVDKIQQVKVRTPVCAAVGTPVQDVIRTLQEKRRGCALVQQGDKIVGIFTERDVMTRIIAKDLPLTTNVETVMTPNPTCLPPDASVAEAVKLMSQKGYRHIPLVDAKGGFHGLISARDLLDYLAEHFPNEVYNLPPDPHQLNQAREGA